MGTHRPEPATSVAVVGAGLSGLTCATALRDRGVRVTVFDKARGTGGRSATRRTDEPDPGTFDHGAQYFTARSEPFSRQVETWVRAGHAAEWEGRIVALDDAGGMADVNEDSPTRRYVGVPGMSAICRDLASGLTVTTRFRVTTVELGRSGGFRLGAEDGRTAGPFGTVVFALPAPQVVELVGELSPTFSARLRPVAFDPCLAVMVRCEERVRVPFDGAFVDGGPLAWIARDSSKPGRPRGERWILHATGAWSRAAFDDDDEKTTRALLAAFAERVEGARPTDATLHRWRYSVPTTPLDDTFVLDEATGLAACGDWCGGPRIEGAYRSGMALATRLLDRFPDASPRA